jgi:hypothetical protein
VGWSKNKMEKNIMTIKSTIHDAALRILQQTPDGMRYTPLCKRLAEEHPAVTINTIRGYVVILNQIPGITNPEYGLFKWIGNDYTGQTSESVSRSRNEEEIFYGPFAEFLKSLEDCTETVAVGGSRLREKWGTPDVMGTIKSRESDIIKFPTQIVSAEIKTELSPQSLITGFGQACAYKLFSNKIYLVIPNDSDWSRIDRLCPLHGIGLVLFDRTNVGDPDFEIRHRAWANNPDSDAVNDIATKLKGLGLLFT